MSMTTLDEKLTKILQSIVANGQYVSAREFIITFTDISESNESPIKIRIERALLELEQAYIEAGYVNTKAIEFKGFTVSNIMTGQAWYDRFVKELEPALGILQGYTKNGNMSDAEEYFDKDMIKDIARRAAGVDHDKRNHTYRYHR